MNLGLEGKIALVTGASSGLGFATAKLLAQEGAFVAINSRNAQKLKQASERIQASTDQVVQTIPADLTQPHAAQEIVAQVIDQHQKLDILITNAGGPPAGLFESFTDQDWFAAFELSFMSIVRLIRAALPYLKQSSTPAVLTVTSLSVIQPIQNLILSNSIRAAAIGLTKTLALELGHHGIRFNSILPGWTETERVTELMSRRAETNRTTIEEEIKKQAKESPLARLGQPEEFANAAVFLVSPAASYITGTMLNIDGGMYKGTL